MEQTPSPNWYQGSGGTKNTARVVAKLNDPKVVQQQGLFSEHKETSFNRFFSSKKQVVKNTSKLLDWIFLLRK